MLPEVGAAELLVIAAIALIVVGPKDLPILMRKVGKFLAHMRGMAAEFRASFDEMARQSELDELRREVEAMRQAAHEPLAVVANRIGLGEAKDEIESSFADRLPTPPLPDPPPGPLTAPLAPGYTPEPPPQPAPAASRPRTAAKARQAPKARTAAKARAAPKAQAAPKAKKASKAKPAPEPGS